MGERVIPPACVEAVHDTVGRMGAIGKRPKFSETCEDVARAVLDAFVAGEGRGSYFIGRGETLWFVTDRAFPPGTSWPHWVVFSADTEREARAVAAVLNYLEAKGE